MEGKFRGRKKDGKWLYGSLLKAGEITAIIPDEVLLKTPIDLFGVEIVKHSVEPETVGQFTGMLDKNEKSIYEGDIVKVWPQAECIIGKVFHRKDGLWCIYLSGQDGRSLRFVPDDDGIDNEIDVIGNIHDDAGLLKE